MAADGAVAFPTSPGHVPHGGGMDSPLVAKFLEGPDWPTYSDCMEPCSSDEGDGGFPAEGEDPEAGWAFSNPSDEDPAWYLNLGVLPITGSEYMGAFATEPSREPFHAGSVPHPIESSSDGGLADTTPLPASEFATPDSICKRRRLRGKQSPPLLEDTDVQSPDSVVPQVEDARDGVAERVVQEVKGMISAVWGILELTRVSC